MDYEEFKEILSLIGKQNGADPSDMMGYKFELIVDKGDYHIFSRILKGMALSNETIFNIRIPQFSALTILHIGNITIVHNLSDTEEPPILKYTNKDGASCLKVLKPFIY